MWAAIEGVRLKIEGHGRVNYVLERLFLEPMASKVSIFSFWLGNSCLTMIGQIEPRVPDFEVENLFNC